MRLVAVECGCLTQPPAPCHHAEDMESSQCHLGGVIVRDLSLIVSNYRSTQTLDAYLKEQKVTHWGSWCVWGGEWGGGGAGGAGRATQALGPYLRRCAKEQEMWGRQSPEPGCMFPV